jgi:tetratricopeptide (TPR) repeat protein
MQRALDLEPFHMDHNVAAGFGLYHSRRYDQAIVQFRRTLELDPNWGSARFWLAETYATMHDESAAVTEYLEWLRQAFVPDQVAPATASLKHAYTRSGWRAFWTRELELHERGSFRASQFPNPYFMARRYARLGDRERAMAALEAAYTQRHHLMVFLKIERVFDSLRSDARFQDLVRRVNIP